MTLSATADLVAAATADGTAVLAFNVVTLEHAEGIAEGVERAGAAALMQVSENTVRFHGGHLAPLVSACARIAERCAAPLAIHLDHFQDVALLTEVIDTAADLDVTSIMVDAAHLPFQDNIDRTRAYVQRAHRVGLWVEAELGEIGGKLTAHAQGARTDPDEAAAFAETTGVDGLAVAVGSTHAMTTRDARLDLDLIGDIASRVAIPLVLHGSSGVSDPQLRSAVRAGIRKVNVGTALNLAYTEAVRDSLSANPSVSDPRPFLATARQAISDTVVALCRALTPTATIGEHPER
ncbi:tagatose-bisphosphate aldolase [Mycolicibacterium mageritense DSM 44476 = CIP 104973]|uniref:Fructose-bisphosphate aldolase n=1 Tax=Mycolicibacterium mageritense TaxID=53462 RepID=A0ABM7HQP9_MYCME|nr:class II fructose-bisphosphate aldolase [Mycolicibacterium mageritense]MCC9183556.1 class II fructose-bisphosphate aldolase family protein [Mycolicibacterium mageritense]BBX32852.1 fructose-bisphosphate aldolase [Mycolicibacterium mageritense]CDO22612.1 tagatose-1,6-bisphosphate aldolase GatY [Mycolicibacterium mageritense DSM 44476 = CIP 104973]